MGHHHHHENCHCEHHHHDHEHHHEHHHHEHGGLKKQIIIIISTILLLIAVFFVEKYCNFKTWQLLLVYLVPYLLIGAGTLKEAAEGLADKDPFNEHFLMSVATIGALCIGFLPGAENQFAEAVFVMLFFQIGELFESYAEGKSRDSISHLMDIRPDSATVLRGSEEQIVSPETVEIGETVIVKSGEKIPLDGVIIDGTTSLNTSALTGESLPSEVTVGDPVNSGCVNISGVIQVRTTKTFGESTASKIINLVENANDRKSKSETFITKFARVYTPIVVFAALALAFLPPLFSGNFVASFSTWLYRALMFLIVSCPCALVISVPLTFFGGIGGASRNGILVKGANYMDVLSNIDTIVFDKTGTLTKGLFSVEAVHPEELDEQQLLHLAAHVEHFSTHPIGAALREAFPEAETDDCEITDVEELAGYGVKAKVQGKIVCVGNAKMMQSIGAEWHECHLTGTIIHVSVDGEYAGHIVINDTIKDDSIEAISELKELGIGNLVMLTGDRDATAKTVAEKLSISNYYSELLPTDKVNILEDLLQHGQRKVAFVGDGINDAPALARADVGIAMGGLGSDAAIEAADVVLMEDNPAKVATAVKISKRTIKIALQNVWFAIIVKILVLILAAFGVATMWMAVFADVGVTVLAVLNAMRALEVTK